ncbi:two-component sensor histidine kinase [Chryseobacterium pennae]|uniref:Two-component sensor histidine kinase n=1 Tax=Chryseobacterium pennae TaxID=2258962 RepID=A0A3D9C282_9FLAO|nr:MULTISPECIES: histidine kinase [Chryseobacterium]MCS4302956.1 two-component system sensor histidine kinase DesK [Chryseobacterium sp. BIGb0232]REC59646.1 two-component sensor histidine kinase [Chryseobacterium pennae]ROS14752.1 two-component system sensor histidine kinase DesK [Chryseobacterium nakagawai]
MKELPEEIKATYILAVVIMMLFVGFIIFVVLMYNRKQLLYFKEKQLKEAEYQNQLLQKELEKQKLIEKERERISHDMHDDLGAGISALKLHSEFLKQKVNDDDLQNDIDELLKTSEEMNISMREMLWSLNSGNDTLERFIDYAIIYSGNFLKKTKIVLKSECIDIISDTPISTELRRNLFLCLKEAVNNIYKHSRADTLKLSFYQDRNIFIMKISDNGTGIPEECHKGNGLRNMKRRMSDIEGKCEITPEDPGTSLTFEVVL